MKRLIFIAIVIVATLCFNSCTQEKGDTMNILESNISSLDLIKNEYKFSSVTAFLNRNPDINRLNHKYKVNFYKRFSNLYYTVIGTEQGPIIVYFDADMQFNNWEKIAFSEDSDYESLKRINQDASLDDVMRLDPNGKYPFLYSGWSDYPKFSCHIFKNGTVCLIRYDSSDKVVGFDNYTL